MPRPLTDRVIIITGASSGIGEATARAAGRAGMDVVIAARRIERLQQIADQITAESGREVLPVAADVSQDADVASLVEQTIAWRGRVDVMFANAGYGYHRTILDESPDDHRAMFETNYFGSLRCIHAVLPHMRAARDGHILLTSSILGRLGMPGHAAYCASKSAQLILAQSLRGELHRDGIHVSAVCPIGTKTEFFKTSAQISGRERLDEHTPSWMMQSPDHVARRIIACLRRPRPEVWPSRPMHYLSAMAVMCPRLTAYFMRRTYRHLDRATRP